MAVQHVFSNAVADGTVTSIVRPSDWNSYHNQLLTIAGNTSGQSTVSGTNIVFQGGNNVTLSANTAAGAATIVVSGPNTTQFLTTAMASNAGSNFVAASATIAGTNITGTIASNGISLSGPATTQFLTTAMASDAGSNFVAASATIAGTNITGTIASNGLSLSVAAGGGSPDPVSFWYPYPVGNNTSFHVMGQNTVYMQQLAPGSPIAFSNAEFQALHSFVSSSNSQVAAMTIRYGLYSMGTGASTASIVSVASSSMYMQASYNSSTAVGFTCAQGTQSFTVTSNNSNLFGTALSGAKLLYLPFTTTLQANKEYFWAMHFSSATTVGTSPMRFNMLLATQMNSTVWGELKVSTYSPAATNQWEEYDGIMYSATSAGLPAAVHSTQMQMMVSRARIPMMFENE